MVKKILRFLNPIEHFGDKNYSVVFPFIGSVLAAGLVEFYAYNILKDPNGVGMAAIFIFIALIIYFSFREGIIGGFISTSVTIAYYLYIIYSRNYKGTQLVTGIETIAILGILYYILAGVIGWLKQVVDTLIERETDEKRRLLTIIQQLPVGVIITDNQGVVVQANKQIEEMVGKKIPVGFKTGEETLVKSTYNGKRVTPSQNPLMQSIATGKSIVGKEFIIKRKNGKEVYLQVNASAIHNRLGKLIAAASIITDITQQKEMEKRKDDFINMASHELKTPLTSMKLYIETLSRSIQKYNDEKSARLIKNIKHQTDRLQILVNDLLDVSRLQTGKLTFNKEHFDLSLLVHETLEVLENATNNQEIIYDPHGSIVINADRFRIYQVFTNLLTNSIKYSPQGTKIIVKVYKDGKKAIVSVQDKGIGIDSYEQKRIFEKLYQVAEKDQKTFPGFGMGLFISKEIINRHKGAIWVESQKGKGSTFYFSLPL